MAASITKSSSAPRRHVVVVGAGMGGLSAASTLAAAGFQVSVLERAAQVGGKMRTVTVESRPFDAGPTVLTLRPVLERIFAMAGARVEDHLELTPLALLARHYWPDGSKLDLHADMAHNEEAIAAFSGAAEVDRFRQFHQRAAGIHNTLRGTFMESSRPSLWSLTARVGVFNWRALMGITPFESYWAALNDCFRDPRLVQLYARYATYVGSSPFESPATLMLIAHVEQLGVWRVKGGMHALACALARLAERSGASIQLQSEVTGVVRTQRETGQPVWQIERKGQPSVMADAVIMNADPGALAAGHFGPALSAASAPFSPANRSLSAVTAQLIARAEGRALAHHTVFFSADYAKEFRELFGARICPTDPTLYVCAQDRDDITEIERRERLMLLMNAPAVGDDSNTLPADCERIFAKLEAMGLRLTEQSPAIFTTPHDFNQLFPGTGGALYGRAGHGWRAAFNRPGARSRLRGLYLAGGGVHPGAGVPMAALSGLQAAQAVREDLAHA